MMTTKAGYRGQRTVWTLACLAAAGLLLVTPAHAAIVLQVQSVIASPNSTGNTLEIDLTNTGPSAQNIEAFAFQLSVANANISFDAVHTDMSTVAPYIFAGDSFDAINAFAFASLNNAQTLVASDLTNSGADVSVAAGATFGLGRVFFNVANGAAPGPVAVSLAPFPSTSLSDAAGANVAFSTSNGTITISSLATVPEPSFLFPIPAVLLIGFLAYRRQTATARA